MIADEPRASSVAHVIISCFICVERKMLEYMNITPVSTMQLAEAVLLIGILIISLLILGRLVKIYNYDYEGNPCFRGYAFIQAFKDYFWISIPRRIHRKAMTNEYAIALRVIPFGMNSESVVVVSIGARRVSTKADLTLEVSL